MSFRILPFVPELVRHLFKKPATVKYPYEKLPVPKRFRGKLILHPEQCIACRICVMDCPAEAIEVLTVSEAEKKFKMIIHHDRCLHCEQCVESCPRDTLEMTPEFEMATFDRHALKDEYIYTKASPKAEAPKQG